MCTKFGVDSSSRFPLTARTNKLTDIHTDATERATHTGGYTAGVGNKLLLTISLCMCGGAACLLVVRCRSLAATTDHSSDRQVRSKHVARARLLVDTDRIIGTRKIRVNRRLALAAAAAAPVPTTNRVKTAIKMT